MTEKNTVDSPKMKTKTILAKETGNDIDKPQKKSYSLNEMLEIRDSINSFDKIVLDNWDALLRKSNDAPLHSIKTIEKKVQKVSDNNTDKPKRIHENRDRLTKEQNGIVLGPQRRSFNSGCFVPVSATNSSSNASINHNPFNSTSLVSSGNNTNTTAANNRSNNRRIGSGRMLCSENSNITNNNFDSSSSNNNGSTNHNNRLKNYNNGSEDKSCYEKRMFGRDFDKSSNRSNTNNSTKSTNSNNEWRNSGKDSHRGHSYSSKSRANFEEEPEWFSGGPTSQSDTIELKGFDDSYEEEEDKVIIEGEKELITFDEEIPESLIEHEYDVEPAPSTDSEKSISNAENHSSTIDKNEIADKILVNKLINFLSQTPVSNLLDGSNDDLQKAKSSGSKFRQWFQTKSNDNNSHELITIQSDSSVGTEMATKNYSNENDCYLDSLRENNIVNDILKENEENELSSKKLTPNKIIELLKIKGRPNEKSRELNEKAIPLEELEKKIRSDLQIKDEKCDKSPSNNAEDYASLYQPRINVPYVPTDLVMKLHQFQQHQEMQQKQNYFNNIGAPQSGTTNTFLSSSNMPSIPPSVASTFSATSSHQQLLNEIRECPEALTIFYGLKQGVISVQSIYQHLNNPSLQNRYRDMLISILRVYNAQQQRTNDLMQQQHLLRQSKVNQNQNQNLVHKMMLMKKLEVQQQQQQQQQNASSFRPVSPIPNNQSPLSFTPTSVLRKMVADKDSDSTLASPLLSRSTTPTMDRLKGQSNNFSMIIGEKPPYGPNSSMTLQSPLSSNSTTNVSNSNSQFSGPHLRLWNQFENNLQLSGSPQCSKVIGRPLLMSNQIQKQSSPPKLAKNLFHSPQQLQTQSQTQNLPVVSQPSNVFLNRGFNLDFHNS